MNQIPAFDTVIDSTPTTGRVGVLLANLGTPDAPTPAAIRRYLRQFLSDQRVVEIPRAIWLPILYGVILPLRPLKLAHAYQSIWTKDGSPLLAIGRQQCAALQEHLGPQVPVALGMTYGNPSIAQALQELESRGARGILILPLYPQYSATTTAAVLDAVMAHYKTQRWIPELRSVHSYHADDRYIQALAASVHAHWAEGERGEHLLMSFHSIPKQYCDAGDPYFNYCEDTAKRVATALDLTAGQWSVSYQSRVGRAQWLSPYTEERVVELARSGLRNLDVICPGFSADCLETLEEVSLRYGKDFCQAGGQALRYVPALNADQPHINLLAELSLRSIENWQPPVAPVPMLQPSAPVLEYRSPAHRQPGQRIAPTL
ncbi:MAG: ferrochelatase [Pseudomonadota bacterium]|nr:ferrochelatase [Pseudomonadota bacterium]